MNFTNLEWALMLTIAVLLWRNRSMYIDAMRQEMRANKYADWLIQVAKGDGKVVQTDTGWEFKPKENHQ